MSSTSLLIDSGVLTGDDQDDVQLQSEKSDVLSRLDVHGDRRVFVDRVDQSRNIQSDGQCIVYGGTGTREFVDVVRIRSADEGWLERTGSQVNDLNPLTPVSRRDIPMQEFFHGWKRWVLYVTLVTACFVACLICVVWYNWQPATPDLDVATAETLEVLADEWCQNGARERSILESDWPIELRRLRPQCVTIAKDGVYVQFGSFFVASWGLFILSKDSSFQPQPYTDPSFRKLYDRVYKYEIKG